MGQCETVTGEPCPHEGTREGVELGKIAWTPPHLRTTPTRPGAGAFPFDGTVELSVDLECAKRLAVSEGEWVVVVSWPWG